MNRLEARVSKLVRKTHTFISAKRLRTIRDYAEFRYGKAVKPDNLSENVDRLVRFSKTRESNTDEGRVKTDELMGSPGVWETCLMNWAVAMHKEFTSGVWTANSELIVLVEKLEKSVEFKEWQRFDQEGFDDGGRPGRP